MAEKICVVGLRRRTKLLKIKKHRFAQNVQTDVFYQSFVSQL